MGFLNREHAARMLASQLSKYTGENPVILGFPPGGVPMAKIISDQTLGDLDIYLIHRLCLPSQPDIMSSNCPTIPQRPSLPLPSTIRQ